jgi:hypothetical protein
VGRRCDCSAALACPRAAGQPRGVDHRDRPPPPINVIRRESTRDARQIEAMSRMDGQPDPGPMSRPVRPACRRPRRPRSPGAPTAGGWTADRLALRGYAPFHATRAEFLRRLGRRAEAVHANEDALALTANRQERRFLAGRRAELGEDGPGG